MTGNSDEHANIDARSGPITATGRVIFSSTIPKTRAAIQPETGKRIVVNFAQPHRLRKGQTVTVRGRVTSEGFQSIAIADAELVRGGDNSGITAAAKAAPEPATNNPGNGGKF